jgi:hypothetical protein
MGPIVDERHVPFLALIFGVFFMLMLLRLFGHNRQRQAAQARLDLQMRLIDKINNSEELRAYLESGAARQITDALAPGPSEAYNRIIAPAMAGAALTIGGGAIVGLGMVAGENWIAGLGGFTIAGGIACLVAALVAYGLSKSWGLLERRK